MSERRAQLRTGGTSPPRSPDVAAGHLDRLACRAMPAYDGVDSEDRA